VIGTILCSSSLSRPLSLQAAHDQLVLVYAASCVRHCMIPSLGHKQTNTLTLKLAKASCSMEARTGTPSSIICLAPKLAL